MRPYLFHFVIEAHPQNPAGVDIGGAAALIWVFGTTISKAREMAIHYINNRKWMLEKVELSLEITSELIADMGDEEVGVYREAERNGIAGKIYTWKKNETPNAVMSGV